MFEFDHMKIIKQKCLDALTNILCVPVIEEFVLTVGNDLFARLIMVSDSENHGS